MTVKLPHDHHNEKSIEEMAEQLSKAKDFEAAADAFKHLSDPTRIKIYWLLCHCEECVMNISAFVGMSSPAVSHHLSQMKASGLIVSRREGKEVYYKAADTKISGYLHKAIEDMLELACPED